MSNGTINVQTTPLTNANTAVCPSVCLLIIPNVVSIDVAPPGAMAEA